MATERRGGHHDDVRAHDVWLYAPLPPPTCIHTFHFISWLAPSPADDDHAWIAFLFLDSVGDPAARVHRKGSCMAGHTGATGVASAGCGRDE